MLILMMYRSAFFFKRYCDHRDLHPILHSFPTRRSSDLHSAGSTAHVADLSIGSADIVTAIDLQAGSVGDIITEAAVPQGTTAADTIDVVSTVTGTGTAGKARVYALVVDMTAPRTADEVDRDLA